jgi:hypothetical protein
VNFFEIFSDCLGGILFVACLARGVGVEGGDDGGGCGEARHRVGDVAVGGGADGGGADVHAGVRGVCDGGGPEEGDGGGDRAAGDRVHGAGADLRGRALQRGVDEPGAVVRAGRGGVGLPPPLGLLGRALPRRRARRARLRRPLHVPRAPRHPPAPPQHRLLTFPSVMDRSRAGTNL